MTAKQPEKRNVLDDDSSTAEINVLAYATDWLGSLRTRAHIATELALAEAKLAAVSLAVMVFLAVMAAVLLLGAWGMLIAGLTAGLMRLGMPLWALLAGFAVFHVAAALVLAHRALRMSEHMSFARTRGQFGSSNTVRS